MSSSRTWFRTSFARSPMPSWRLLPLWLWLVLGSGCHGATGPARRHLEAVELAERATSPQTSPTDRKRDLERARDELVELLTQTPRLPGAALSLATIHAWLGDSERAMALRPAADEMRPVEKDSWLNLEHWSLATQARWSELEAAKPGDAVISKVRPYRETYTSTCARKGPTDRPGEATPLCDCESDCRQCLETLRNAWCEGALTAAPLLQATERTLAEPRLELARNRLRGVLFASQQRFADALVSFDLAREAGARLTGDPDPALLGALDLDRALILAWLGRLDESRALIAQVPHNTLPAPLPERARALSAAINPALSVSP